ncbi:MAG: M20/M25/M40 family metallo-hydrolase, partial [Clostridia bacterium]|nr:M20/M25/M40 family metallo-hydrolase [Clostridia bacterium]
MKNFMPKTGAPKTILRILLVAATLAAGIVLGLGQIAPPPVDEHAAMYPAYERMMDNIQRLAVEPHPSGSDAIEVVRAALLAEITGMGLTPTVEEVPNNRFSLQNILVKIDAPGAERGVLFVSHYDSVPRSPGAADDMLSVCAMLEAMRAHAENGALQSDLYFLFTDGEEIRMLGAWAFVDAHPELRDAIGMVVNLEARGNRGALLLFETSPKAYPLLQTVL